ncbi:unnamed protein product [Polarella glacialis]|uniref:Mei2-like C-terminal RNA recognition motif domain-containing protein n=1 Tax=Polarella glacialis TaxID=89957 RepID=A0A813DUC5_POLGL|nr:unnamed protein product [Polarella glacialis]
MMLYESSGASAEALESGSQSGDTQDTMSESSAKAELTTVMMRNIPDGFTSAMFIELVDKYGLNGTYDLVYMPIHYQSRICFGYAFINCVSHEAAYAFTQKFNGFTDWGVPSDKVCETCWSDALQGLEAHIERYRNSPVMHEKMPDEFRPLLFSNGQRISFPIPTKTIRPPRMRMKAFQL